MTTIIDFDRECDGRYMGMEIPPHTKETLDNYFIRGWMPGGFCESMLAKDFNRAISIADTANRQMFWAIAVWIKENAPLGSWGSYNAISEWSSDHNCCRSKFADKAKKEFTWRSLKNQ